MNKERFLKYVKICKRAERMGIKQNSRLSALMDIESADKEFDLRLDEWLNSDDLNFAHDFIGIQNNIVRDNFTDERFGFFIPRFAKIKSN